MTDINKPLEEEMEQLAIDFIVDRVQNNILFEELTDTQKEDVADVVLQTIKDSVDIITQKLLHSSRWRNISDGELPDLLEEVIVEDANGKIQKGHRYEVKKGVVYWSTDFTTFYNIVKWKPIN